jgi:hypothetical protein
MDGSLKWKVCIHNKELCTIPGSLQEIPPYFLSFWSLRTLITWLDYAVVFDGIPDEKFMTLESARKGEFCYVSGKKATAIWNLLVSLFRCLS